MSDTTRTHRPTTTSPRYTKAHGIGRDRMRWPARLGTYNRAALAARLVAELPEEGTDDRHG